MYNISDFETISILEMVMSVRKIKSKCEDCVHFVYDEELDADICDVDLDEDDYLRFITAKTDDCPYYRFFDEYKSVQKQN